MSLATSTWLGEIDGLAKRQYNKNTIETLINQSVKTYGKLTTKESLGGDSEYWPVETGQNEGGQGNIAESGDLPTAGKPDTTQVKPTPRVFVHHNKFTGLSMKMLSGSAKSFANAFTNAMDSGIKTSAKELNAQCYRNGTNVLGYVTTAGTTTLACTSGIPTHFRPGVVVSIGVTAGTEVTTGTVESVTMPTTVNGTFSIVLTTGTVSAASSYVWRKAEYGIAMQGLAGITATSGTFMGIDKSSVDMWKGLTLAAGSVNLSDAILHQAKGRMNLLRGTVPNTLVSSDTQFRMYLVDTVPQVRYESGGKRDSAPSMVQWSGMDWVVDTDCGLDEVYMFDKSKFCLFEAYPLAYDNSSGSIIKYVPGTDTFSAYAKTYCDIGTQNTGAFIKISGLNVPIV